MRVGFSGDTYNTAVYLGRVAAELGVELDVGYLTGLGDDDYSERCATHGRTKAIIDRALVVADRTPGIYAIRTSADGERTLHLLAGSSPPPARCSPAADWVEHSTATSSTCPA